MLVQPLASYKGAYTHECLLGNGHALPGADLRASPWGKTVICLSTLKTSASQKESATSSWQNPQAWSWDTGNLQERIQHA